MIQQKQTSTLSSDTKIVLQMSVLLTTKKIDCSQLVASSSLNRLQWVLAVARHCSVSCDRLLAISWKISLIGTCKETIYQVSMNSANICKTILTYISVVLFRLINHQTLCTPEVVISTKVNNIHAIARPIWQTPWKIQDITNIPWVE